MEHVRKKRQSKQTILLGLDNAHTALSKMHARLNRFWRTTQSGNKELLAAMRHVGEARKAILQAHREIINAANSHKRIEKALTRYKESAGFTGNAFDMFA